MIRHGESKLMEQIAVVPTKIGTMGKNRNRLIAECFPLLSKQSGLSIDILDDLKLSDKSFGSRYKRGKNLRWELLENMENRLELDVLRNKVAQNNLMIEQLQSILLSDEAGLRQLISIPTNLEQARAVLSLYFLRIGQTGPEFTFNPTTMLARLKKIASNDLAVEILRELVINISVSTTAQDIATRNNLVRQTIYDRQNRIISKLETLIADQDFFELTKQLQSTTCVTRNSQLIASEDHPLVAILMIPAKDFPSIQDLVAVGFWGIAHRANGNKKSFRRTERDDRHWIACPATSKK